MPLGDSITYGATTFLGVYPGGYRGGLAQLLQADHVEFSYAGSSEANPPLGADPSDFRHEGHPGYRIDQIAHDLSGPDGFPGADGGYWMRGPHGSTDQPQVVVLLIGTNDISQGYDPQGRYPGGYDSANASERSEFVSHLVGRLDSLLAEIDRLDPGTRIVLCTIPPMGELGPDPTAHAYDEAIRTSVLPAARLLDMRIVLADVETAFLDNGATYHELISPDGVHPTPMGYNTMAGVIAPAVEAALRDWPA